MTNLSIEIDLKEVYEQTKDFKDAFQPAKVLKAVGLRNLKWTNDNFKGEGNFVGGWPPLKQSTIAKRRGSTYRILQDTGDLKKSFDLYGTRGVKLGLNYFEIGSVLDYAATHHYGDRTRGIPKRQILPNKDQATKISLSLLKARLKQLSKKHG